MQKLSDPPATICPVCSKNTVIKLVSAAGFQLKGTGWYATDFKNKGKLAQEQTGNKAATENTKSDSNPVTISKSESKSTNDSSPSTSTKNNGASE